MNESLAALCDVAVAELTHATSKLGLRASAAEYSKERNEEIINTEIALDHSYKELNLPDLALSPSDFNTPKRRSRKWKLNPRAVPRQKQSKGLLRPVSPTHTFAAQASVVSMGSVTPDTRIPNSPPHGKKNKRADAPPPFLELDFGDATYSCKRSRWANDM